MARLEADFTPRFKRDYKRLQNRHFDMERLHEVFALVLRNDRASLEVLRQRHNMHALHGEWAGRHECHVANVGDWLLIWRTADNLAVFERTGTHDDLFR